MIGPAARTLLAVSRKREQDASLPRRALPFVVGVTLLLFSGYFERFLRPDSTGHALTLYLFVYGCLACGLTVSYFLGPSGDLLQRTSIFPLTPATRFTFAAVGIIANPLTAALVLPGAFSVGILYGATIPMRAISAVVFVTLMLLAMVMTACAMLIPRTRVRSASGVGIGIVVSVLAIGGLLFVLRPASRIPIVTWATAGILAAAHGDVLDAVLTIGYLTVGLVILTVIGRRTA